MALALTALGLALRLLHLGAHSLWFDEALEVRRAQTPWPQTLWLQEGPDPPGLRLILTPIASLTIDETALRLPSALLGAATVWLVWRWLETAALPNVALISAGIVALLPVHVYYSQEVSQYALAMALATCLLLAFERVSRFGRARDWALATAATLGALASYYGVAMLLPSLDVVLAFRLWKRRRARAWLGFAVYHAAVAVAVGILYLAFLRVQFAKFSAGNLSPWFLSAGPGAILHWLPDAAAKLLRFQILPYAESAQGALLLLPAALVALGTVAIWRKGESGRGIACSLWATFLLLYAANGLGLYPFGHRYTLPLLPLLVAAIAAGIEALGRPAGIAAGAALATLSIGFLPNLRVWPNPWLSPPYEDLRPVLELAESRQQPGDSLYIYYGAGPAYAVYRPGGGRGAVQGLPFRGSSAADQARSVVRSTGAPRRFWLVASHIYGDEVDAIALELERGEPPYRAVDRTSAPGARAILFARE